MSHLYYAMELSKCCPHVSYRQADTGKAVDEQEAGWVMATAYGQCTASVWDSLPHHVTLPPLLLLPKFLATLPFWVRDALATFPTGTDAALLLAAAVKHQGL